jgi:predicted RNase H-like nuclease
MGAARVINMSIQLIGVDCATVSAKVGLAFGWLRDGRVILTDVFRCAKDQSVSDLILAALQPPTLLALDAPLGWPAPLGRSLIDHAAGQPLPAAPDALFNRETDRFIQATIGKRPMEVGADRIARTAHAALRLLVEIGNGLGRPVPLAWRPELAATAVAAIEVYPAATLIAHGLPAQEYKQPAQKEKRGQMAAQLAALMAMPADQTALIASADALDAAVCLLAAADFLTGRAMRPPNEFIARREGWIWTRTVDGEQVQEK